MAKEPKPRKPKTKADAPGAPEREPLSESEVQELFLHHRTAWTEWKAKRAVVDDHERKVKAALKADGYTVKQMEIADALITVKGEAKITGEVKDRLQVAAWVNHPMGRQLEMFNEPDRTPLADRAYAEGRQASMENRRAAPRHAPDTEAYRQYMAGFHEHQRELAGGIRAPKSEEGSSMAYRDPPAATH